MNTIQNARAELFLSLLKCRGKIYLTGDEYRNLRFTNGLTRPEVEQIIDGLIERGIATIRTCGNCVVIEYVEVDH